MERGGRVGLVFGPEKHGLTREDLSHCHLLVEIPTDAGQPFDESGTGGGGLPVRAGGAWFAERTDRPRRLTRREGRRQRQSRLELLAGLVERTMVAADYSPAAMREANRHDLRLLLRRLAPTERDVRRMLGLFRRILWRLER